MAEKNKVKDEHGEDETTSSNGGDYSWGTLEELLLACAVNRHGSNSWDSIADELQKRVKLAVSPSDCHQKYLHLKRRFHFDEDDGELLRVVDELRKLRVEELKHEVQRHDVSIVSLKMKVKRLEEEREKSLSKVEEPEKETDLRIEPDENGRKTGEKPDGSSPEKVITGDSAENRSFNESNSTNHNKKGDKPAVIDERELKSKREPEETSNEPDPVRYRSKDEPGKDRTSRPGESVSESKRESVKQQQQSSDVQSSASLSKKKRRRFRGLGGGSSGDEAEEISPANKRISVKSQPLIRFFEILQSHKHGSVFQRRLPSQETEKYRNIVRQHMDLDTVQSKLEKGNYSDCHPKFYRDILLIFTNAVLFYRKSSAEHIAARELRKVVIEEISHRVSKPNKAHIIKPDGELQHLEPVLVKKPRSSTTMVVCRRRSSSSMQALSESIKSKSDLNHAVSNNNNDNNIISKKGGDDENNNNNNNNNNNKNNNDSTNSSNVVVSRKKEENEKSGGGGESVVTNGKKVVTKERSSLGRVGLRLSNSSDSTSTKKMIGNGNKEANNNRERMVKKPGNKKEESSREGEFGETMSRKKMTNGDEKTEKGTTTLKKQGVANFLKRMKQNSPSQLKDDHESEEEEEPKVNRENEGKRREKTSNNDNNNGKKRNGNAKRNRGNNEGVVTRGGNEGRRGEREVDGGSRRATGRPPKRKAALMSSSGRSSNTPDSGKGGGRSVSVGRDSGEKTKKKPRR